MRRRTRLRVDTGAAVGEFCRLHPIENPAAIAVIQSLHQFNDRAAVLARQQRTGTLGVRATVAEKAELRKAVRVDLEALHQIVARARTAQLGLAIRFSLPNRTVNHQSFLASARAALAQAEVEGTREALIGLGMPTDLLDRITQGMAKYENAVSGKERARAVRIGARADLEHVAGRIMETVRHLDTLYELAYRDNPELLAAWKSARNVPWPGPTTPTPPTAPSPGAEAA